MIHAFDTDYARQYGMAAAAIIHNLQFWITRNRANGENFREGRTWTYNSVRAFEKVFDYLTKSQIRTALEKLEAAGVLIKGEFNERPTDHTKWYAFADEDSFLGAAPDLRNSANRIATDSTRIAKNRKSLDRADGNQDGKQDGAPDGDAVCPPLNRKALQAEAPGLTAQEAADWLKVRDKKHLPLTATAWAGVKAEAEKAGLTPAEAVRTAVLNGWGGFKAAWMERESTKRAGGGGAWWASAETKLAKAVEVGVGPAYAGEPDSAWQARIQAAIDNGGRPPEAKRPAQAVTIRDPGAEPEGKAKVSPENRAAFLEAARQLQARGLPADPNAGAQP